MPDLRYLDCRVDFSIRTFGAVVALCKDLGMRHPEELSLCKPLEAAHLKKNFSEYPKRKLLVGEQNGNSRGEYLQPAPDTNTFIPTHSNNFHESNGSLDAPHNGQFFCAPMPSPKPSQAVTPISSPSGVSTHCPYLSYLTLIYKMIQCGLVRRNLFIS
jgi:kindlin 2